MLALALALIGGLFALSHAAPFPFLLEAFRPGDSVWRVKPPKGAPPVIYLTFDDGPNQTWTPAVLDALREHDVRATFFVIDSHMTPHPATSSSSTMATIEIPRPIGATPRARSGCSCRA